MRRPRPGVGSELLPVTLILIALAGTLGLVVSMHRKTLHPLALADLKPPAVAVLAAPDPDPEPPAPDPPPKPTPPPIDPTPAALARVASQLDAEIQAARAADRKAASLEAARQSAVAAIERSKRREAIVRGQLSSLEEKAKALEMEADALAMDRDVLAQEKDASKAALAKAKSREGSYAVLPHKGANGTWQRPVILECRDGQAILQPAGATFSLLEMSPHSGPRGGPLISAVARELIRVQRTGAPDGDAIIPYIYFIVRPDGIRSYYEARGRLEPLGIAFGYELADQDWNIDFPDLDELASWDGSNTPKSPGPIGPNGPGGAIASAATPRTGQGDGQVSGSGGGNGHGFVWPADRPNASRRQQPAQGSGNLAQAGSGSPGEGPDQFLWPTQRPGAGGRKPGESDGFNDGDDPLDLPASPSQRPQGFSPAIPGAGPNGAAPPLADIDADSIIRNQGPEGGARGYPGADFLRPDPSASRGPVPMTPSRLPGFDPANANQASNPSNTGPSPSATPSSNLAGTPSSNLAGTPGSNHSGTSAKGRPTSLAYQPETGVPVPISPAVAAAAAGLDLHPPAPTLPGRTRIDPTLLAEAAEEDPFGDPMPQNTPNNPSSPGGAPSAGSPSSSSSKTPKTGGIGQPSSSGGTCSPGGNVGVGLPSQASSSGTQGKDVRPKLSTRNSSFINTTRSVDVPLELTVACFPDGVVIHPGGYRLSLNGIRKEGALRQDLQTIVRNHELIDPMVHPKPRVQFIIEPGGADTYWLARQKTVLNDLSWPVSIQVAGASPPQVFPKERF